MNYDFEEEMDAIYVPDTSHYNFNPKSVVCIFNDAVECKDKHACAKCGWNPAVQEIRSREIRRRLREQDKG